MTSWEERTLEAAAKAASEAVLVERARCLWVLDDLISSLESELQRKLLIEQERHLIETKLRIARSLVAHARRGITLGVRPPKQQESE